MAVREPTSFMRKGFWGSVIQNGPAPYIDRGPGHYSADNVDIISPGMDPQMTQMHPIAPSMYTPSAPVNYAPDFFNQRARRAGSRKKTLAQLLGYSSDDPMMQKFFADMELDPAEWNMPGDTMMNRMDWRSNTGGYIPGSSIATTPSESNYSDVSMFGADAALKKAQYEKMLMDLPPNVDPTYWNSMVYARFYEPEMLKGLTDLQNLNIRRGSGGPPGPPPPPPKDPRQSITQIPDMGPGLVRSPAGPPSEEAIKERLSKLKPTKTSNAKPERNAPLADEIAQAAARRSSRKSSASSDDSFYDATAGPSGRYGLK